MDAKAVAGIGTAQDSGSIAPWHDTVSEKSPYVALIVFAVAGHGWLGGL